MNEPLLNTPSKLQGGLRTLPFILANEGFERAAFYGLEPNMIVYLMGNYGLEMATGSNILFLWAAATNFTPILGAFLADSYVGRFPMIAFGSIFSLLGTMLLWLTTMIPGATPYKFESAANTNTSPTPYQLILLFSSFGLMSIGTGGIRSSTLAFGADQIARNGEDENAKPNCVGILESFFNWYYFSVSISVLFGLTCVVYIQDHAGWQYGFGVPTLLMLLSVVSFFLASSFYVKVKPPKASLLTGFAQVIVASWRNRHYEFPSELNVDKVYHVLKGSTLEFPSEKLRSLNKACIVKDPRQDLNPDGMAVDPWRLCTIDQVEDFKSIINLIPLWSTGIMMGVNANTTSFRVLQAFSMDRHVLTPTFEIPPGSFGTFALITLIFWLILYDRVIIPMASKVMGKPVRLHVMTRMGIGLLLLFVSLLVSGVVESIRRDMATKGGIIQDNTSSTVPMSALWLVPQVCLFGLAEALTAIAQIELFYSEFPKSMSSIASNLQGLSIGIASLFASFIIIVVDNVTKELGRRVGYLVTLIRVTMITIIGYLLV
uniref:NPF family transporter n=1 Tax=Chenopodium quinoa TaxID=63459 RepID=A0A803LBR1_CHEQI